MAMQAPRRSDAQAGRHVDQLSDPTGAAGGFAWLLDVVHEIAHAQSGPDAACLYLDADGGEPVEICPAMCRDTAVGMREALADQGVEVAEQVEPARLYFPALGGHEHALVLPLAWQDGTAGVLVVAAPTPPMSNGLGRVMELAGSGLGWVRGAADDARSLAEADSERARLDVELGQTRMFLELQEMLVGARTTAEVVAALAAWLEAPVAVQMPNLIVAESAGEGARELALSSGRSEAEQDVVSRATTAGRFPVIPVSGRLPARVVAPITGAGGEFAGFLVAAVGERGRDVTRRALGVSRSLIAYQMAVRQDIEASVATLRQTLLTDLLEKRLSEHLATQAAKLGHDLTATHVPLAIGVKGGDFGRVADRLLRVVEHASAQASAATGTTLIGVVDDMVLAFVPEPVPAGDAALAHAVHDEAAAEGIPVVVGIGPACTKAAEMPDTAARARWAVQVLRTTSHGEGTPVAHFDALGVYGLLFDHQRADELALYAQRWLGPLVEYDRRHRSELVETLRQLFRQRSLSDAAAALHIHISTLKYRVGRIEEILGKSVESWDNVFHLELALRVLAVSDHLTSAG
jgi:sugar diacid utilization regulator